MERELKGVMGLNSDLGLRLDLEIVDLGDLDALEEDIVPCTGCGCHDCDAN